MSGEYAAFFYGGSHFVGFDFPFTFSVNRMVKLQALWPSVLGRKFGYTHLEEGIAGRKTVL